jgi:SM-20-related protein
MAPFDLYIVENFVDAQACREIIAEMRASARAPAPTYGKGEASVDESVRRVHRAHPRAETLARITRQLENVSDQIGGHFHFQLGDCEEPQFLVYRVGDFFVAHQDGNTGLINIESDRLRRVSVTVFLNDQTDYEGGSLVFSDYRTGKRVEFAGKAGTLLAFHSETTHEVTPVKSGERYSIVTWFGAA